MSTGNKKPSSRTLLQLSGAALAVISNNAHALGANVSAERGIQYRYSNYQEARSNNSDRYDIDIHQLHHFQSINDDTRVAVNYIYEKMSGASPWYIVPDEQGKPVQVMSGASISEQRDDVSLNVSKRLNTETGLSATLGYSTENDYQAKYVKFGVEHEKDGSPYGLFFGLSLSRDKISPTDAVLFDRFESADKDSNGLYLGAGFILNRNLLFSSTVSFTRHTGELSDPYKRARILDSENQPKIVRDNRPQERQQWVWSNKLRYHLGNNASLHVDYRLFDDDWEIRSHTLNIAWYKTFNKNWQFIPELRYYNQSDAYFYAPYYNGERSDGYYSSDYRLSPYGALSTRLKIIKTQAGMRFSLAYERYDSDADFALKKVRIENPGLVDFYVVTAGIDVDF